jgi:hypothetical protein
MTVYHGKAMRSDRLHPRIYWLVAELALWMIVSAWAFFFTGAYTSVTLAVVTGFIAVAVGLPLILSRVGYGIEDAEHPHDRPPRYHDWASGEFDAWQCELHAREATLQVLLPIAAAAFGMTLIGLAFYLATPPGAG